jgi:cytochrome c oxidase subunit 2
MFKSSIQLHPTQASSFAPEVDALYFFLLAITAFFTLLIFVLVAYFAIKYRRRSELDRPADFHAPLILEALWIGVPFVICLVLFFWGARVFFILSRPPENAINIHVVGKQWMWKIQHPDGRREINELHVPVGVPVKLIMASQDVIHSFFIPAFRVKQDVVPGRYTTLWFNASQAGSYHLFCAEYCGNQHSGMIGRVVAMEPEQYQAWLAGTAPDEAPAVSGGRLFASLGCITCHGVQAPSLAGLYGTDVTLADGSRMRADDAYLRESILDSGARVVQGYAPIMPSYRGQITEEQLFDLMAYIKSLAHPDKQSSGGGDRPIRPAPEMAAPFPAGPVDKPGKASQGPTP